MKDVAPQMMDVDLSPHDIQALNGADAVAAFFARLGYNTDARTLQTANNLGVTAEGTSRPIKKIELIADQETLFQIYLFELTSVTISHTRALARTFRNRAGNYLLILTSDYEHLDFVLLEKYLPGNQRDVVGIATRQVSIRPRILTVERRKPSRVHLRVIRRFTWTESDPFAQYDKLLSAYAVADWSEEFFNNRALFSDYYLLERLPMVSVWAEDPGPSFLGLRKLYQGAMSRFAGKGENLLHQELLGPALRILGFEFKPGKKSGNDTHEPDFRLFHPGKLAFPIGLCLIYPWGRSLDGKDDQRDKETPEENPGAVVVSLLEKGEAPWVVVTNGKLWRLYAKRAHSRATNYYEVDLEEILAQAGPQAADPSETFRYFWMLFRSSSFLPVEAEREGLKISLSLLDQLLLESEDYAKELGERLKGRVFEDVFPHLASGFITYIRERDALRTDVSQDELDRIFEGTLTFLYRLLFLLYAEARDLLPVKEVRGYFEASLTKLKREVAEVAGTIADETGEKLKKNYTEGRYELYDRLTHLFRMVDKGDPAMNVPVYNGGLFLTAPEEMDNSQEAKNARFLNNTKVPDRFLARALDLLARDIDPKRHDLVFIDYKSLGVRQLGSIYEGLLEFKLRIADRKLAIVKEKGRERYVHHNELDEKDRDRADRQGNIVKKGQVYLENDKGERKATGSYYTPDHIVKYIVDYAVGPVLQKKFETLRPKIREAQIWHKDMVILAKKKGEPISKYEFGPTVEKKWRELVDELFNLKVLDPAMGSGHFLVEVVDYITDKTLDFLNAFPWNPVFAHLALMRETILQEMDEQGITIDSKRLTDINLLKRHVLKRCIYGVDLNPMAVELAKVSLWLDCFTLGAPLSFLDHHLKYGNSLIGVSVKEAEEAVEPEVKIVSKEKLAASSSEWKEIETRASQLTLFGSRFARLLFATDLMRHVGELSDITSTQVLESRTEYRKAWDALVPFKRILDVCTSQWFGNASLKSKRGHNQTETPALEFLKSRKAEFFINAQNDKALTKVLEGLPVEDRSVVETTLKAAKEKRFFHWELEFPEVFYGPRPGTMQVIERLEGAGFDSIIGNPPFIDKKHIVKKLSALDIFWQKSGQFSTAKGIYDVYMLFIEQAGRFCKKGGIVGLLTPIPWLTQKEGTNLRKLILKLGSLDILDFSSDSHFLDALVKVVAVILHRGVKSESLRIWENDSPRVLSRQILEKIFNGQFRIDVPSDFIPILEKIYANSVPLRTFYTPTFGLRACSKKAGEFTKGFFIRPKEQCKNPVPYIEASDLKELSIQWGSKWLDYQPKKMYSPRSSELFLSPKVLVPSLLSKRKVRAVYDHKGYFVDQSLVCISATYKLPEITENILRPSLEALTMQLNSATISFYFAHAIVGEALGGGAIHATPGLVGNLPIFVQRALDQVTPENVDQVIWKVCGLSDTECQMIIRWHAILEGSKHV